jgi:hypothetical protein
MTDVLVRERVDVDLDQEPQCEHAQHDTDFKTHEGPATHVQVLACGHCRGLRCAKWVEFVVAGGRVRCPDCPWTPMVSVVAGTIWFVEL